MRSGFGQFCPVAVACEVIAERWTPLILRELLSGAEQFNTLHRGVPRISRPLLAKRLRELEKAGVIAREKGRYRLTDAGREAEPVIEALAAWGQRWTTQVRRDTLDPAFLMWNIRRRVALDRLPPRRAVACFDFLAVPRTYRGHRSFWLLLERGRAELRVDDPGGEVDLQVDAELAALTEVWLGERSLQSAVRSARVRISGAKELVGAIGLEPTTPTMSR